MKFRQRIVLAAIWVAVAVLLASTLDSVVPASAIDGVQLFAIALALFLAVVYFFDPWNVVTEKHALIQDGR